MSLEARDPSSGARPAGALHRRIEIATTPGEARAVVEDDFHHFRVVVRHADGVVTQALSEALRSPNTLCPAAGRQLAALVGMPLSGSSAAALSHTDARQQCTHMIDLAGLAIAAAARGVVRRAYLAVVRDRQAGQTIAKLERDGVQILQWTLDDDHISAPPPFAGHGVGAGFTAWTQSAMDMDQAEAALVLRRAVFISHGRGLDLDAPGARTGPIGGCWSLQPERAALALRNVGSTLDFTGRAEALTVEDAGWLHFEADAPGASG